MTAGHLSFGSYNYCDNMAHEHNAVQDKYKSAAKNTVGRTAGSRLTQDQWSQSLESADTVASTSNCSSYLCAKSNVAAVCSNPDLTQWLPPEDLVRKSTASGSRDKKVAKPLMT